MKFTASIFAIMLASILSTVAAAQAQEADVTTTKVTTSVSLFPDAEVSVWTRYNLNTPGKKYNELTFEPHFRTPILNKFLTLDAYVNLMQSHENVNLDVQSTTVELGKEFVANDFVTFSPRIDLLNPGKDKGSVVNAVFYGVLGYPIETGDGKVRPFILTESSIGVTTSDAELTAAYTDGPAGASLTDAEVKAQNLEPKIVGKARKYPIALYNRAGFEYSPEIVNGLKLTAATNFISAPSDTYKVNADNKQITGVETKWATTTQPMFRVEYAANDSIHLRNDTTYDLEDFFGKTTADQEKTGAVTNTTRLIYTIK